MRYLVVFLAAALASAGCGVSKQVVAEKDAALEACRGSLGACEEQAKANQAETERLRTALSEARSQADAGEKSRKNLLEQAQAGAAEKAQVEQQLGAVRQELQAAQSETATLQQRETELRAKLDQQLRECSVEIERLKSQLTVRTLEKILFAPASADIVPTGKTVLDAIAASLADGEGQIRVEGHTDELPISAKLKGAWFSNWELSAARAASVVRYFQFAHHIDPKRMAVVGRSAFQPVAPNDTEENRARNRRVEIVLSEAP